MRNRDRINQLELELFKVRIELDLIHEILNSLISVQNSSQDSNRNMDSGKWYPRRLPPQQ